MRRGRYRLHGFDVSTPIALTPALRSSGASGAVVRIDVTDARPIVSGCADEPVLRSEVGGAVVYEAFECDGGWWLRLPGFLEFRINVALDVVQAFVEPGVDPEYLPIVVQGALSAFLVTVSGGLCLHASAVEHDGGAVAFAGPSGQGKTTVAAMVVAAGAGHVTDDILGLRSEGGRWMGYRGTCEARLRPAAVALRDCFAAADARSTVDDRLAVSMPRAASDRLELRAVVLPRADRTASAVLQRRLDPAEAFIALHQCLRLVGWRSGPTLGAQFRAIADLAERVPVVEVTVPWGVPFTASTGASILEAVDRTRGLVEVV